MEQAKRYKGFIVTKSVPIDELQCHLTELQHEKSGSPLVHIANDDPENFFCISFKTLPTSSNGICHILEHTVLCGSKKYPVKDPFFSMSRRSLNTFMNALTGSDFTCYPAASQIEQDFYNLLDVYIDAVFHPNLSPLSFIQEGWRLEFSVSQDPSTDLEYKGVVMNEMKGALSSPMARVLEAINRFLYPDSPYGYNSGGDPEYIPTLSHEELIRYHKSHYHPSRAIFFFSGNIPLEKHLDFLEPYLNNFKQAPPLPEVPKQEKFHHPVYKELFYPYSGQDSTADQSFISFCWLTSSILDQLDVLALSVLDIVLMETDASLVKMALLKSGKCKQVYSMIDAEVSQIPYAIIINGCHKEDVEALKHIVFDTLKKLSREGIPPHLIENALHQLELAKSEITGDSAPFGLSLFYRSVLLKQHGARIEDGLHIHALFDLLRQKMEESSNFFGKIIDTYFLNNQHFVTLVACASKELASQEREKEQKRLKEIKEALSEEAKARILQQSTDLLQSQEEEDQNIDLLPKLALSEVPKKSRHLSLTREQAGSLDVFSHPTFTNGLTYANLLFPMPYLAKEDFWLLRLFTLMLPQIGCGNKSYQELLEYLQANTGGVSCYSSFYSQISDPENLSCALHLRGKALDSKAPKLFEILFDMATSPMFQDPERIKELIIKHASGLQTNFVANALKYASSLSTSTINPAGVYAYASSGLEYYNKITRLASKIDSELDWLLAELERLQNLVLCTKGAHLVLSCSKTQKSKYQEEGFYGLDALPAKEFSPWKTDALPLQIGPQARCIPSPVAFTSVALKNVSYANKASAHISLAANIFDNVTIHKRVREQGGAYGGGSSSSPMGGTFSFYSYRDPNIASTIEAFKEAIMEAAAGQFDDEDLEEAKRELIQHFDSPIAPGTKADVAYCWWREGKTEEARQSHRDTVLSATKEDVSQAVRTYIQPAFEEASIVTFGPKELIEKEVPTFQRESL
jgi:Zn-dependent M16 (insulinase) family peptidase